MIAIDPGLSGGIVTVCRAGGNIAKAYSMPKTDREIIDLCREAASEVDNNVAYLEDIVLFTGNKMPSSSGIKYGASWGFLRGVVSTLGYRLILVPPKKWQAALGLGSKTGLTTTVWKNKLKQRAEQLYPNIKVTLATADALLIAEAATQGKLG